MIEDIESLNHLAVEGELEVTALSVHAYGYVMDKYALLASGGSFGDRVRPDRGGAKRRWTLGSWPTTALRCPAQ